LIPLPQGIGPLLRERDLLAYGRFLYMVELKPRCNMSVAYENDPNILGVWK
jgi:hypothetical protein